MTFGVPGQLKRMKYILVDSSFICVREIDESEAKCTRECEHNMHTRRRKEKIQNERTFTFTYANPTDERERMEPF